MMKKSRLKLTVRRDTIRALAGVELARVAGGIPGAEQFDSAGPVSGCPNVPALPAKP
jgi:hypothetical protein